MEILKFCTDCDEIQFKEDGSWAPMRSKKEAQEVTASCNGVEGEDSSCFAELCLPASLTWVILLLLSPEHSQLQALTLAFVLMQKHLTVFLGCLSSSMDHQVSHQQSNRNKKVEVIDLTIDSSSDEEEEEPSAKRSCPSLSPASPINNKR